MGMCISPAHHFMLHEAQFNEDILILDGCRVDIENNMNMRWSDFVVNRAYIKQCDMCEWSETEY